jgi:hypothetical protein
MKYSNPTIRCTSFTEQLVQHVTAPTAKGPATCNDGAGSDSSAGAYEVDE